MHMSFIVATIIAFAMGSQALAQRRDAPADPSSPAVTTPSPNSADAATEDARVPRSRSGFGQVMGLLTRLLQEAAIREQQGAAPNAGPATDPGNSAVTVRVTPVAGRTSFFTQPRRIDAPARPAATAGIRDAALAPALDRNALAVQPQPGGGH